MTSAVVVGAGPNGLTAAAVLARAGLDVTVLEASQTVGGGVRSDTTLLPGLLHDHCSAIHPMAVGSPILNDLDLARHGLRWLLPEVDCVHPLDDGTAGVLLRSVDATADGLGRDGRTWRRLLARPVADYDELAGDILGPLLRVPSHPLALARFGTPTLLPATRLAALLRTPAARALWGGVAAHAWRPLDRPLTSAIGLGILTAGHRHGWAVAAGGSQSIATALTAVLAANGGKIQTGVRITRADELPTADVTVLDLDPGQIARIYSDRLPARTRRAYRRFRRGPAAYKVDLAVEGGVPWLTEPARRAGTVHLGGGFEEIAAGERALHEGRMPERPFVLVGQQYLADPQRSVGDVHPVWAYAHVPYGYGGDGTAAVLAQLERFAPGVRERIVAQRSVGPAEFAATNPNFAGGDIMTGAKDLRQLVLGPRATFRPYDTGIPGTYVCSAATPPGPGAHGMCGAGAAKAALRSLGR